MQHLQPNTTLQGGKYRIERVLGQGGFGITYLAQQTIRGGTIVVKEFFMKDYCTRDNATSAVLPPTSGSRVLVELYRKKFIKEARNLLRLHHPNIINVMDVFEENDTVYYVMPYLSGGSLQDYVKAHGVLTESKALKYIRQIASALKYMHEKEHICHFDVKPANIVLDNNDNALLIDFGISKNYDASGHQTTSTPVGLSEGYAPIEQYQQKVDEFSPASDVYALGATLFYLLHGKRPVSAVHRASGIVLYMSKRLSQGTKDIIKASMKLSRYERSQNVDIFLKDTERTIIQRACQTQQNGNIEARVSLNRLEYRLNKKKESNENVQTNRDNCSINAGVERKTKIPMHEIVFLFAIVTFLFVVIGGTIVAAVIAALRDYGNITISDEMNSTLIAVGCVLGGVVGIFILLNDSND